MASHPLSDFDAEFDAAKRQAPRLALSLPGKFLSTLGDFDCILINLSRTGVLFAIPAPVRVGSEGFLRCGPIDHFVIVKRQGLGVNAAVFEIPVSDAFVAQVRAYQKDFAAIELLSLQNEARAWTGIND